MLPLFATIWLAPSPASSSETQNQTSFFNNIKSLCGSRFEGAVVFPEDPGDAFRDKTLVAIVESCDDKVIRIPFHVGEDKSRTWVLSHVANGLELKHDHRHADGTPDEVTMYGGTTNSPGSDLSQSFPADDYTAKLIPEAATNVWSLTLSADSDVMTYYLERHGKPRFKAKLKRVR